MGETQKHYTEISVAKGILIILMVVGHSGAPSNLVEFLYLIHMPCFFFISGFLFKEKYLDDVKSFINRKFKGLYVPFVKYSFIFLLLHNALHNIGVYHNYYSLNDFRAKIFQIFTLTGSEQLLGGYWFLKELLYASIISILFIKLITITRKRINTRHLLFLCIFFVGTAYLTSIAPFKIPTIGSRTLLATAYFIAGYTLKEVGLKNDYPLTLGIAGYVAVIITSLFFSGNIDVKGVDIFAYFAISTIGSISTIYISKAIVGSGMRMLDYIGKNTFYILTYHFISFKILSFIIIYAQNLTINRLQEFPVIYNIGSLYWILYTIIGIFIPILIKRIIDKAGAYITKSYICR